MDSLTMQSTRVIIKDFAKAVKEMAREGPKPTMAVILFRDDVQLGTERPVMFLPLDLIKFRKHNGRISIEVYSHEKSVGRIDEDKKRGQEVIRGFLSEKDKEKTKELGATVGHEGQREPAVVTSDGFLINGNRRKMVLDQLHKEKPGDERFKTMKVVILPGENGDWSPGPPPTLLEIEQIENRYQLQSDGKAEYTKFDSAVTMRRKEEMGMSLDAQLLDDSSYAGLSKKEFKAAKKKVEDEYLKPLDCIDRYLESLNRPGLYMTISAGVGDSEGRWQAFLDYYNFVFKKIADEKKRIKLGIGEDEVGKIEDVAFKLIRLRKFPNNKVHKVIREYGRWIKTPESKKELLRIGVEVEELAADERLDGNGKELEPRQQDQRWGQKNESVIIRQVKRAEKIFNYKVGQETPLTLLQAALDKLNHRDMDLTAISILADAGKARELAKGIQDRASDLEDDIYEHQKKLKKLLRGHSTE